MSARQHIVTLGSLIAIGALLVAWATAGTGDFVVRSPFIPGDSTLGYYDLLADAFLEGHLYIDIAPSAALMALTDPYDPAQNWAVRLHDASLFNGRYYLYWGPAPAFFHAFWLLVTGTHLPQGVVQVAAGLTGAFAFWMILSHVRRHYFMGAPSWMIPCCVVAFAAGGVSPYLLGRPIVYHESLMVACAFVLGSWQMLLYGLDCRGRSRFIYWLLAGSALGLAIASRITYLGYAVGFALVSVMFIIKATHEQRFANFLQVLAFACPIAVTGILLAAYNFARFGEFTEFGTRYLLQGLESYYQLSKSNNGADILLNPSYLPFNLAVYLASLPQFDRVLPFVPSVLVPTLESGWPYVVWSPLSVPTVNGVSQTFIELPLVSLPVLAPISLLWPLSLWWLWRRGLACSGFLVVLAVVSGAIATLQLLAVVRYATIRYAADFAPAFTLVGSIGLIGLAHALRGRGVLVRALMFGAMTVCLIISVMIGTLLGLGAWVYSYPERAYAASSLLEATMVNLQAAVVPWSVQSTVDLLIGQPWQTTDGHYAAEALVPLRAFQGGPSLVLGLWLDGPDAAEIDVLASGVVVARKTIEPGFNTVVTRPLRNVQANQVINVQLRFVEAQDVLRGAPTPIKVFTAALVSSFGEGWSQIQESFRAEGYDAAVLFPAATSSPGEDVVLGGLSGGWITAAGIDLLVSRSDWQKPTCLIFEGSSNLDTLPSTPDVTAVIRAPGPTRRALPSDFQALGNDYRIRVELGPRDLQAPSIVHLAFSSNFVPAALGLNSDTRELVIRSPSRFEIAPGPCTGISRIQALL